MIENLPPFIRARKILDILDQNEQYEQSQQRVAWNHAYTGNIEKDQAVFDVMPQVTDDGQAPITAVQVGFDNKVQAISHNVCHAVRRNPALLANSKVTDLILALEAFIGDEAFPSIIPTESPYTFEVQPDLSAILKPKEVSQ